MRDVTMAGVLLVVIFLPLLQLTEASDLEGRQLGASVCESLAKIGVDAKDIGGLDDAVEQRGSDLDIHRGRHDERMRCSIGQLVAVFWRERRAAKQMAFAIRNQRIEQ